MEIKNVKFIKSASEKNGFIIDEKAQFAFVGRSNVGKSSLINYLCSNKKLAKTSNMPGRTRLVNYFLVDDKFYFVDLPGYGFQSGSKGEQDNWDELMNSYFVDNAKLKLVFLLLDARHLPSKEDLFMLQYLAENDIKCQILLTKIDKLSKSDVNVNMKKICNLVRYNENTVIKTSSENKKGIEEIKAILDAYLQ